MATLICLRVCMCMCMCARRRVCFEGERVSHAMQAHMALLELLNAHTDVHAITRLARASLGSAAHRIVRRQPRVLFH